jgi:hypothetical protein
MCRKIATKESEEVMQGDRTENMGMGLKEGDPVLVTGIKGRFIFQSVRMDGEVPLWVTVARAREDKRQGTRMITPDRVCVEVGRGASRVWMPA